MSTIFIHGCAKWIIASIKLARPKYCDYINSWYINSGILFEMQFPQLNHPSCPFSPPSSAVFAAVSAIWAINLFFHAIIVRIVRIIVRTASISEIEFLQNSSQSQSLTSPPSIMTSFSLCLWIIFWWSNKLILNFCLQNFCLQIFWQECKLFITSKNLLCAEEILNVEWIQGKHLSSQKFSRILSLSWRKEWGNKGNWCHLKSVKNYNHGV